MYLGDIRMLYTTCNKIQIVYYGLHYTFITTFSEFQPCFFQFLKQTMFFCLLNSTVCSYFVKTPTLWIINE